MNSNKVWKIQEMVYLVVIIYVGILWMFIFESLICKNTVSSKVTYDVTWSQHMQMSVWGVSECIDTL